MPIVLEDFEILYSTLVEVDLLIFLTTFESNEILKIPGQFHLFLNLNIYDWKMHYL